jgi:hypothetical protein
MTINRHNSKPRGPVLIGKTTGFFHPQSGPESNPATIRDPLVLLRLKSTPTLCFVRVTSDFNRTLLRLKSYIVQNDGRERIQVGWAKNYRQWEFR